jgi:hypothetical protein
MIGASSGKHLSYWILISVVVMILATYARTG